MKLPDWLSPARFVAKKRRARYEFLKNAIRTRHFAGYGGLVVDFKQKFTAVDIACFRPPMYQTAKTQDGKWCIFWDRVRLSQEIGTGAPLKEGETLPPDHGRRMGPDCTPETIDERKPLTLYSEGASHGGEANTEASGTSNCA